MKQFLIILFSLSTIVAKSQVFKEWGSEVEIISIDTTIVQTVRCEFLITDTSGVKGNEASIVYFVNGWKIIIRKGELSKHWEQCECPEHIPGCCVYHQKEVIDLPPVVSVKYLRADKGKINKRWYIQEL